MAMSARISCQWLYNVISILMAIMWRNESNEIMAMAAVMA
jgi:hypothetical protein